MKRKFNREERAVTERNVKKSKEQLKSLTDSMYLYEETKKFNTIKREFDNKMRPLNQAREDKQLDTIMKDLRSQIDMIKEGLIISQDQLNNGVEVK